MKTSFIPIHCLSLSLPFFLELLSVRTLLAVHHRDVELLLELAGAEVAGELAASSSTRSDWYPKKSENS